GVWQRSFDPPRRLRPGLCCTRYAGRIDPKGRARVLRTDAAARPLLASAFVARAAPLSCMHVAAVAIWVAMLRPCDRYDDYAHPVGVTMEFGARAEHGLPDEHAWGSLGVLGSSVGLRWRRAERFGRRGRRPAPSRWVPRRGRCLRAGLRVRLQRCFRLRRR